MKRWKFPDRWSGGRFPGKRIAVLFLFTVFFLLSCKQPDNHKENHALPVIMDMVFSNPGEAMTETKYNDPAFLKKSGYNGMVVAWHIQCAITYDSFEKGILPEGSPDRQWVLEKQRWIRRRLEKAEKEGMPVYAFTDVLVIPSRLAERYGPEIVRQEKEGEASPIHGKLRPDIARPVTRRLIRAQVDEIFSTFPQLDGLVIRFGETYLFDTPYHTGGSPVRGSEEERVDGHVQLLNLLREEVCVKRNKKLFYRTWDFGFFHTRPDIYLKITDQVEPHPNLFFSIKYTKGDFQRLLPFNPTLGIGRHQYVVEYQCQPEYYGKGAHPAWVFEGMLNGFEEYSQLMRPGDKWGVKDLKGDPHFKGLWTWSRGGGWQGPYITNELWCDLNALSAVAWARDTLLTAGGAFRQAALARGVEENSVGMMHRLLQLSAKAVVRGHGSLIDIPEAHFNVWWIRDHFMSGMYVLNPFFDYLISHDKVEEAIREKEISVAMWKEMEEIAGRIRMKNPDDEEYLRVSVAYGRIKYEIIRNAFTAILLGYAGDKTGHYEKDRIRKAITRYDALWKEWKKLKQDHPSCATLYQPYAFAIDAGGVYADKEHGMQRRIDRYRAVCNML